MTILMLMMRTCTLVSLIFDNNRNLQPRSSRCKTALPRSVKWMLGVINYVRTALLAYQTPRLLKRNFVDNFVIFGDRKEHVHTHGNDNKIQKSEIYMWHDMKITVRNEC